MVDSHLSTEGIASQLPGQDIAAMSFTETLPFLLVSLLERRYLSDFQLQNWRIESREASQNYPLFREVTGMGRPSPNKAEEWGRAMPHVLSACHEPGHALVMALHGQGNRHRLYLGGRRMGNGAARSTDDYLNAQESAFKAFFSGLQMGPLMKLDSDGFPEMMHLLQSAPTLALVTGIPSGRSGRLPLDLQSLDRLARATGNQRYVLLVVAEPLEPQVIDQALDASRRLKSEVHAYTRRTISRTQGETEGISQSETQKNADWMSDLPIALYGLAAFCQLAGAFALPGFAPILTGLASTAQPMVYATNILASRENTAYSRQKSTGKSWSEAGTMELLNANAEACEELLQQHIQRLQSGRSAGWWRTAVYIAAEHEAAAYAVSGALRSLCSGDITALDPMRTILLPEYTLREAVEHGWVLSLQPALGDQHHPLGKSFDAMGTCLTSEELAVLVNLPRQELPGVPMHDLSDFALSVPPATEDSIELGSLQDSIGHDLGPVTVTPAELNRHVFVTGLTGYGKTNTCMQILLEAYNTSGVPFLVLEPAKTEYRQLAHMQGLSNKLCVYSIGSNSFLPFRLNPLSPVPGIPLGRHIDLLKAVFNASFPMFAGMPYILEEALLEVYAERGWSLFTSQNAFLDKRAGLDERGALTPSLQDLHDKIEVVLARKQYGQEIHQNMGAALRSRLRRLMVGNKGMMLNTRYSTPLENLFHSPTIIELQNLGDDEEKAFVMAILFVLLYEYAEIRQQDIPVSQQGTLQHLTLVEEAHRLLQATRNPSSPEVGDPRAKAVSMFTDMLAEMRAYGEGFIIADQIPTRLAPETLKNSNLKIVHRLVALDDRQAAGSCINLTEQQMRHLNTLAPGFAIVHDERIGEAVLTRIHQVKDTHVPDIAQYNQHNLSKSAVMIDKTYLFRHAGCRSCPAPCQFYHHLEEIGSQIDTASSLQPFLESLLLEDVAQAWQRWQQWLTHWLQEARVPVRSKDENSNGIIYCRATQAAYLWLGDILLDRNEQVQQERRLSPAARLQREHAARALGKLFIVWVQKTQLDEEGRAMFVSVCQELQTTIAKNPPP